MEALLFKHALRWSAGLVSVVALCSVAVHPFGTPKQVVAGKPSPGDLEPPPEVTAIFKRSCMDCHSNQTVWPWYSYVAPVSWLVEKDVRRGRDQLDLSDWSHLTFSQREQYLADIATAVKNLEMPLPQYTLVHRRAGLSNADVDTVYGWARTERRKLKASHSSSPSRDNTGATAPSLTLGVSNDLTSRR